MIGLNLGSGQRRFESTGDLTWINVDVISRPPDQVPDLECDIRSLPYGSSSVDICVLHHVAEHFHLGEGEGVVAEAWRVLRRGGSLIVTVPFLRELAMARMQGKIDDYIYCVNLYGAWQGQAGDDHHWGWWDEMALTHWMDRAVGSSWSTIRQFDWRPIPGAPIARDWWILGVEAVK